MSEIKMCLPLLFAFTKKLRVFISYDKSLQYKDDYEYVGLV